MYQFRSWGWERIVLRMAQKVVPIVNHWVPEAREKRTGLRERRVPQVAPITRPGTALEC